MCKAFGPRSAPPGAAGTPDLIIADGAKAPGWEERRGAGMRRRGG